MKIFKVLDQNPEIAGILFLVSFFALLMAFAALVMFAENKKFRNYLNKNYPSQNKF
jgi:hypothetical protein